MGPCPVDDEAQGRGTREELVKSKLIRDDGVIFVSAAFEASQKPSDADIEDLIDPDVYEGLVRESYKTELKAKTLSLNGKIPRIVKRFEKAFTDLGIEFSKNAPGTPPAIEDGEGAREDRNSFHNRANGVVV